jgi:ATP-dependent Zn protease
MFLRNYGKMYPIDYMTLLVAGDPFGDFTGLDQNVVQVVSDTKIKFEDVAGNEEAKLELKEVVKF